jgi:hypothetical protein
MEASSAGENRQSQEWFLATLIMEISVQGDTRNVAHRNLFLVSACSPEEAYDPAGRAVRHSFRGVAQLDTLVDGELVKNGDRRVAIFPLTCKRWPGRHGAGGGKARKQDWRT